MLRTVARTSAWPAARSTVPTSIRVTSYVVYASPWPRGKRASTPSRCSSRCPYQRSYVIAVASMSRGGRWSADAGIG
ncbi:Uncharacterised protein [Mycobacteroides abscessus]|nr:Uncharacterised protein [Mycobacteroides abscessus]